MGRLVTQVPNEDPERVKRVLDAKYRTIGVDKDALAQQVEEKRAREAADRQRDEAYNQLARSHADTIQALHQEAERQRREKNASELAFRMTNQLKATRHEWDLNRPDHKQIDGPARVGDSDPRLGPASMQRFDGEDLSAGDRKKAQRAQAAEWWAEQAALKAGSKAAEAEAQMAHDEFVRYQDMVQQTARAQEAAARRGMNEATLEINRQLAEERRLREAQARDAELAANMAELDATMMSRLMTEDPTLAASVLSQNRVRRDHWKGMSEAERAAVIATQKAQMEENEAARRAAAAQEALYAQTQTDIAHALAAQASAVDDFRRRQAAAVQDRLKQQMEEKRRRDAAQAELYANKISDEYHRQWGTSHR
mmetsp:Transcript_32571/g.97196  ORF Transcript_32571/g.97196 Transcript_32571/m.97196 type:complete len:368 (-) Transcript_32571:452-1555(-)